MQYLNSYCAIELGHLVYISKRDDASYYVINRIDALNEEVYIKDVSECFGFWVSINSVYLVI